MEYRLQEAELGALAYYNINQLYDSIAIAEQDYEKRKQDPVILLFEPARLAQMAMILYDTRIILLAKFTTQKFAAVDDPTKEIVAPTDDELNDFNCRIGTTTHKLKDNFSDIQKFGDDKYLPGTMQQVETITKGIQKLIVCPREKRIEATNLACEFHIRLS